MMRQFLLRLSLFLSMLVLGLCAPIAQASPPGVPLLNGYLTGCTGEYFNNISVSGSPAFVRGDGALNFFWQENASPAPGVNVNNYSVRWTCTVNAPSSANYTFNIVTDDGMNVIVDGNLILWAFYDQGPTAYSATTYLNAGAHTVRVEYYNKWNPGTAQVSSSLGSGGGASFPNWKGEYFNNQTLAGAPTITRDDANINFNWGTGSPDPAIPTDYFSARWTRNFYFNAGAWRFTTTTDDGVRLWVDGNLVIDKWFAQTVTAYSADVSLGAGNHAVQMEYFDQTLNAIAQLSYTPVSSPPPPPPPPPPGPTSAWRGQYFNNLTFSGAPVFVRDDPVLNFNWYEGSPGPGMPIDFFAIKWDSTQNIPATGNYTVSATSDDGVRLWIDGVLVIDAWYDHGPTQFTTTVYLTAGAHAVHVEYYDRQLGAMISVQIGGGVLPPPPPPQPVGDVIVDDRGPGWQAGGVGGWLDVAAGIGGHAFVSYTRPHSSFGYNWARWFPTLPRAGYYEVFAYIPAGTANSLRARYWIAHGGRYNLSVRPQAYYANQWASLGTYYFNATGGEYVSLADVTYECLYCRSVVFDAILFSPR
ncbi:MAG: hypothetical protein HY868_25640 [Chloroflexi bacterium]|nr:hypothetical protein [Chloroflexota bacterium]